MYMLETNSQPCIFLYKSNNNNNNNGPQFATYIYNSYCVPARLFIVGGKEIKSSEGTTQGDPNAMAGYGIGLTPLLDILSGGDDDEAWKQVAFADDISGVGS